MSNTPFITVLKKISHPKGDLLHGMKASDAGFAGFGEAYFTTVNFGETKGWKLHTRMQMNLVVPTGNVRFHVHNVEQKKTTTYEIGDHHYVRLTVPPGFWMAFSGIGHGVNMILNLASIEHDPDEAINAPLESYPLAASGDQS